MDVKDLYYYKTVVDSKSILRASEILHIAQPPLSRIIKNLEQELNTILFIRGRELKLTESGKLLYEKAETILSLTEDIKKDIMELNQKLGKTLNIGIVSSSTSFLYNDTKLQNFFVSFPNTRLNISESNTFKLLDSLDKKIIDLAITRTPFNTTQYEYISLNKEPMVLTNNNLAKKTITVQELDNLNLVVYRRFYEILENLFKKQNIKFNVVALVDDAKTAILLAKSINAHAIVPYGAYKTFSNNLYYSKIDEETLYTSLTIVKRKNEKLNPIYDDFIKYLTFKN